MLFLSVFNPPWRRRHPGRREGLEFNLTTPGSLCMARDEPGSPVERAARKGCLVLDCSTPSESNCRDYLGPTSPMNNVCHELSLHDANQRALRPCRWEFEARVGRR